MGEVSALANWALLYAKANWRSFPVKAGGKSPLYKNWQKDATTDPELIGRYFASPERNLGLVCGEAFDAWDIEGDHLSAFDSYWARWSKVLPEAPIASTGRGGIHILTKPTGVDGTRYLYLDGKHIGELKSRGGFIVATPSETWAAEPPGGQYIWANLTPRLTVPEPAPWLLHLLERPVALRKTLPTRLASPDDVVAVLGRLAGSVAYAGRGSRNNYLYWAVRRAIEEGCPVGPATKVFRAAAEDAGLDPDEAEKTIESALGAESVAA